jgi:hypothetical protein
MMTDDDDDNNDEERDTVESRELTRNRKFREKITKATTMKEHISTGGGREGIGGQQRTGERTGERVEVREQVRDNR